jgi:hypothetical protein
MSETSRTLHSVIVASSMAARSLNSTVDISRQIQGAQADLIADIVICGDEDDQTFCAILTCNQNGASKLLRKSISECAVKAVRNMVDRLQKDTALLLSVS